LERSGLSLRYLGALGTSDFTLANGSNSLLTLLLLATMAGFLKNELATAAAAFGLSKEEVVPLANELSHMLMEEDGIPIRPENGSIGASNETSIKSSPFLGCLERGESSYPGEGEVHESCIIELRW